MKDKNKNSINNTADLPANIKALQDWMNSPSMNAIREWENSPTMKAIKLFNNTPLQNIENTQALRLLKEFQDSSSLKAFGESLEQWNKLLQRFEKQKFKSPLINYAHLTPGVKLSPPIQLDKTRQLIDQITKVKQEDRTDEQEWQEQLLIANSQMVESLKNMASIVINLQEAIGKSIIALFNIQTSINNSTERLEKAQNNPPLIKWIIIGLIASTVSGVFVNILTNLMLKRMGLL